MGLEGCGAGRSVARPVSPGAVRSSESQAGTRVLVKVARVDSPWLEPNSRGLQLVPPAGFEPATYRLGGGCSIP
jgi:hypothetical protein